MGFMNAYKRLDNLCRDMNGVGVTGYIEDMKNESKGSFLVLGWKADFNQLRKYRHIRNKIAHENDVDEAQACSGEDTAWLEDFYQRIIKQTDPLALCYKAAHSLADRKGIRQANEQTKTNTDKNVGIDTGVDGITAVIFVVIVIGLIYILYCR